MRDPLAPLIARADRTTGKQIAALRRAQNDVRAAILNASRKAAMATSARERDSLYREISGHYLRLQKGIEARLRELAVDAAQDAAGKAAKEAGDTSIVRWDSARLERYWAYVRPYNGQSLAAVFTDRMTDVAIDQLRAAFVDTYRQASVEGWTANETQKRMQGAWDRLAGDENAFRFVDRSGKRWENARYLQMLHQTTAMRVWRDAYVDRLTESGFNLARISNDGDPDCPVCAAWEGQIVQLSGKSRKFPTWAEAQAAGVGHPNCTHRPVYVDELVDKAEIERQAKEGRVADPDDREAVQARKDRIDIAEKRDQGLSAEDARRAVAVDRAERMIRAGTFDPDAAAKAARQLPPEILDRIMREGAPRFALVKAGQKVGWRHGSAGGVVTVPRDPEAADVLRAMGVDGKQGKAAAEKKRAQDATQAAERSRVARVKAAQKAQKTALAWAKDNFKGQTVEPGDGGEQVILAFSGAKHALHYRPSMTKSETLRLVPGAIRASGPRGVESDRRERPDIQAVHTFRAEVGYNGKARKMAVVARKTNMGLRYYDHYLVD